MSKLRQFEPPNDIVNFNSQGPINGIIFESPNTLQLPVSGTYQANYSVNATPENGSQLSFKLQKKSKKSVEASTIPGSIFFSPISGDNNLGVVSDDVIFKAKSKDLIQLSNNVTTSVKLESADLIIPSAVNQIIAKGLATAAGNEGTTVTIPSQFAPPITIVASSIYVLVQTRATVVISVMDNQNNNYIRAQRSSVTFGNNIYHTDIWYHDNVKASNDFKIFINFNVGTFFIASVVQFTGVATPSLTQISMGSDNMGVNSTFNLPITINDTPQNSFGLVSLVDATTDFTTFMITPQSPAFTIIETIPLIPVQIFAGGVIGQNFINGGKQMINVILHNSGQGTRELQNFYAYSLAVIAPLSAGPTVPLCERPNNASLNIKLLKESNHCHEPSNQPVYASIYNLAETTGNTQVLDPCATN